MAPDGTRRRNCLASISNDFNGLRFRGGGIGTICPSEVNKGRRCRMGAGPGLSHSTWQQPILPIVPYCRSTPTESSPCLGKPWSSTTQADSGLNPAIIRSPKRAQPSCHSHGLCPSLNKNHEPFAGPPHPPEEPGSLG